MFYTLYHKMAYSQKLTMLLHDIEELDLAELSLLSEKIVELSKHKEEKVRLQLLQRNADQDPARVQKIEEVLTSFYAEMRFILEHIKEIVKFVE
jgi:hypothetical protein